MYAYDVGVKKNPIEMEPRVIGVYTKNFGALYNIDIDVL